MTVAVSPRSARRVSRLKMPCPLYFVGHFTYLDEDKDSRRPLDLYSHDEAGDCLVLVFRDTGEVHDGLGLASRDSGFFVCGTSKRSALSAPLLRS